MNLRIAPSILSADFGRLAEQVTEAVEAGADWIHVDVMDGHFVPNLTIGPAVTRAVRAATEQIVDVHLMIESPDRYLDAFREAGADVITVHQEACVHLDRTLRRIRELGARAGVALNPATPVDALSDVLDLIDLLLVMSVNPGFGGQAFIPRSVRKVARARQLLGSRSVELQVDGGVDRENAGELVAAGASVLVAGSAIFRAPEGVASAVRAIRAAGESGAPDRTDPG